MNQAFLGARCVHHVDETCVIDRRAARGLRVATAETRGECIDLSEDLDELVESNRATAIQINGVEDRKVRRGGVVEAEGLQAARQLGGRQLAAAVMVRMVKPRAPGSELPNERLKLAVSQVAGPVRVEHAHQNLRRLVRESRPAPV